MTITPSHHLTTARKEQPGCWVYSKVSFRCPVSELQCKELFDTSMLTCFPCFKRLTTPSAGRSYYIRRFTRAHLSCFTRQIAIRSTRYLRTDLPGVLTEVLKWFVVQNTRPVRSNSERPDICHSASQCTSMSNAVFVRYASYRLHSLPLSIRSCLSLIPLVHANRPPGLSLMSRSPVARLYPFNQCVR